MENVCKQSQDSSRTLSGRADKDLARTGLANLTKRELEDLYYSLFENNMHLKKDLNIQYDKVKILSTKLYRFKNVQRKGTNCKNGSRCVVHDIVEEQKIRIQDLELENGNLLERIKLLKMKLYSHKQFSRPVTSRAQSKGRSVSAEPSVYGSRRNLPAALREADDKYALDDSSHSIKKRLNFSTDQGLLDSETNLMPENTSKEHVSVQVELGSIENKQLQEQISSLQKQLNDSDINYKEIIAKLESNIVTLEEERSKLAALNETNNRKREMQYEATNATMTDQVREALSSKTKLSMELSLEIKKITELEKQLKAAELTREVKEIVQEHLRATESSVQRVQPAEFASDTPNGVEKVDSNVIRETVESIKHYFTEKLKCRDSSSQTEQGRKQNQATDTPSEVNEKELIAVNQNLVAKISQLQNDFDNLKVRTTPYKCPDGLQKECDEKNNKNENLSEFELADIRPTTRQSTEQTETERDNPYGYRNTSGEYYGTSKEKVSCNICTVEREQACSEVEPIENTVSKNNENLCFPNLPSDYNENNEVQSSAENRNGNETPFSEFKENGTTENDDNKISPYGHQPRSTNRLHKLTKILPTTIKKKSKERHKSNERIDILTERHSTLKSRISKHLSSIKSGGSQWKKSHDKDKAPPGHSQTNNARQPLQAGGVGGKTSHKTVGANGLPALSASQGRRPSYSKIDAASETYDTHNPSTSKGTYTVDSKYQILNDQKAEDKKEDEIDLNVIANDDVESKTVQNDHILPDNGNDQLKHPEDTNTPNDSYTIGGMKDNNQVMNDYVASDSSGKTGRDVQSLPEESALFTDDKCNICTDDQCLFDMKKCDDSVCLEIHDTSLSGVCDGANNDFLYSEGEVPTDLYTLRKKEEKLNAEKRRLDEISSQAGNKEDSTSLKVEEALKAISIELSKCRALLEASSPKKKSISTMDFYLQDKKNLKKCLKASKALPMISNVFEPVANFNMHIGKIVFSDEALMNSEEMQLFARWQFYQQPATLIPVKVQRVVDFNFLVEYKLMLTEDFIKYLRNGTFIITLCEMSKIDTPFAKCKVPLKKIMRNPGKKINFFLGMFDEKSMDSLKRMEIGVIDVWCSLSFREEYRDFFNDLVTREQARDTFTSKVSLRTRIDEFKANSMILLNEKNNAAVQIADSMVDDPLQQVMEDNVVSSSNNLTRMDQYGNALPLIGTKPKHDELSLSIMSSDDEPSTRYNETHRPFSEDMRRMSNNTAQSYGKTNEGLYEVLENENWNRMVFHRQSVMDKPDDSSMDVKLSIDGSNAENKRVSDVSDQRREVTIGQTLKDGPTSEASSSNAGFKATNEDDVSLFPFPSQVQDPKLNSETIDPAMDELIVTVLWLAFNEDSDVMRNPKISQIYVAYTFLGLFGAELETPSSVPKPMTGCAKMYFNFKRSFPLDSTRKQMLANMSRQFSTDNNVPPGSCITFTIISEPYDEPAGQENCEDIGRASLYFGDILLYCQGDHYMEVIPVKDINDDEVIIGVLAVKIDGVDVLRRINRTSQV